MPGSWEILEAERNRVLISTIHPPDGRVTLDWSSRLTQMERPAGSMVVNVGAGLPFDAARNAQVSICLTNGFGWLLSLDSDVLAPRDLLTKLLAAQRDFIGALYFKRGDNYPPSAAMQDLHPEDPLNPVRVAPLPRFNFGDIIPVDFLPAGATLYSRRLLEEMVKAYGHPFEWGADPAFGPYMGPDNKPMLSFSEDYTFSHRARQIGYQPWLATGIQCFHEMTGWVGIRGLQAPER